MPHPEHVDAFFAYIGRFGYRKPIERLCLGLVQDNPYPYVRGEAWHVLAKCSREPRSMTAADPRALTTRAVNIAKKKSQENLAERWGACHFLCVSEDVTSARRSRWLKYQAPLLLCLPKTSSPHYVHWALLRISRRPASITGHADRLSRTVHRVGLRPAEPGGAPD